MIDVPVINRRTGEPVELVPMPEPRVCERDGCENSLDGYDARARFCGAVCRATAWKVRRGYGARQPRRKVRANGALPTTRTVGISRTAHDRIKAAAKANGMSVKALVERATDDYINRHFE